MAPHLAIFMESKPDQLREDPGRHVNADDLVRHDRLNPLIADVTGINQDIMSATVDLIKILITIDHLREHTKMKEVLVKIVVIVINIIVIERAIN
jgi:hypothetical protein